MTPLFNVQFVIRLLRKMSPQKKGHKKYIKHNFILPEKYVAFFYKTDSFEVGGANWSN